jgi:hypothetical protein
MRKVDLIKRAFFLVFAILLECNAQIYWADGAIDTIQRANFDGTNMETLISNGLDNARGLSLDVASGKMYWSDISTNKIQRSNLDGTNVEDLVTGFDGAYDLSLDLDNQKIYWGDAAVDGIYSSHFDGSNVSKILSTNDAPYSIAVIPEPTSLLLLSCGLLILKKRK